MNISPQLVIQLAEFIAGIAVLIVAHEIGHFVAARLLKVEVEEFGIGFPPRAARLFTAWGTQFTLNWIPLGGFVRPKGENNPDVPGGLAASSPWVRLGVFVAGPLMNIALGIVLAAVIIYQFGEPVLDRVLVLAVAQESPAQSAGLQAGDVILEVNGQAIDGIERLHDLIYQNLGLPIQIVYQRGDIAYSATLTPRDPPPADGAIGIEMGNPSRPTTWTRAFPGGVALATQYMRSVMALPFQVFRGEVSAEQARPVGYKGLFDVYQQIRDPLWFFMVISMSLGVFNLLPLPALDGGRIIFALTEIIFRRRVPASFENAVHTVGFMLLIMLLIYINVQDFVNPIQLP
ncbi:MAG: M50 family metallopeptidase [Chloroflexi bacterium]|nr:M50 family metallopeptidase [Chloroflexota bacterium]